MTAAIEWRAQWGNSKKFFGQVYRETGFHHPAYTRRPRPRPDCVEYLNAFLLLARGRTYTETGPQPLSILDMNAYAEAAGIPPGPTRLKFLRLMGRLDDSALLAHSKSRKSP